MATESRPRWPGLPVERQAEGLLTIERGVYGKAQGMPTDYRWLRLSDGLRGSERALGEEDISLGPVTEARRAVHWRPSQRGDRLLAIRSYLTPAKDAAGRTGHLERQVFAVPVGGALPPAGVLLTLGPALEAASHVDWWSERTRPEWNDPNFSLRFTETDLPALAWTGQGLDRLATAAVAALKEACGGRTAELAGALKAVLAGQSVALAGLAEPWSVGALAGLLLLLPEDLGRRLVVQGWSFSPRLSWPAAGKPRLLLCARGPADAENGPAVGSATQGALEAALAGDLDLWWAELNGQPTVPTSLPWAEAASVEDHLEELLRNPDPRAEPPAVLAQRLTEEGMARQLRSRLPDAARRLIDEAAGGIGLEGLVDWVERRLASTAAVPGVEAALATVLMGLGESLPLPREEPTPDRIRRLTEACCRAPAAARQDFLVALVQAGSTWRGHPAADPLVVALSQDIGNGLLGLFYGWATREALRARGRPGVSPGQLYQDGVAALVRQVADQLRQSGPPMVPRALLGDGLDRALRHSSVERPVVALLRAMAVVLSPSPGLVPLLVEDAGQSNLGEATPWGLFLDPLADVDLRKLLSLGRPDIEQLNQLGAWRGDESARAVARLLVLSRGGYTRQTFAEVATPTADSHQRAIEPKPARRAEPARGPAALAVALLRQMADTIERNIDRVTVDGLYDRLVVDAQKQSSGLKEDSDRRPLEAIAQGILAGLRQV